jgi:hypothetical protein
MRHMLLVVGIECDAAYMEKSFFELDSTYPICSVISSRDAVDTAICSGGLNYLRKNPRVLSTGGKLGFF